MTANISRNIPISTAEWREVSPLLQAEQERLYFATVWTGRIVRRRQNVSNALCGWKNAEQGIVDATYGMIAVTLELVCDAPSTPVFDAVAERLANVLATIEHENEAETEDSVQ